MVKICQHCGSDVSDDVKFCRFCGADIRAVKPIQNIQSQNRPQNQDPSQDMFRQNILNQDISSQDISTQEETGKKKKDDKYIIGPNQRKYLLSYIIPTLALGSFVWFLGEYYFSTYLRDYELVGPMLVFYIIMVILDAFLFVVLYVVTKKKNNGIGIILFYTFCFISGALSLPITMLTAYESQVHMVVTMSLSADLIVLFMGIVLRENFFAKGHIIQHIILYLIGCAIAEVIFIIAFDIHNFALTIPATLTIISIVSLMLMFYGARIIKKRELDHWIFITVNIFGRILLSLILAVAFIAIIVLIFLLCAAGGGGDFNLGGSGGGSGSLTRKKKNVGIIQ
jgi:hypothetical protein